VHAGDLETIATPIDFLGSTITFATLLLTATVLLSRARHLLALPCSGPWGVPTRRSP